MTNPISNGGETETVLRLRERLDEAQWWFTRVEGYHNRGCACIYCKRMDKMETELALAEPRKGTK